MHTKEFKLAAIYEKRVYMSVTSYTILVLLIDLVPNLVSVLLGSKLLREE